MERVSILIDGQKFAHWQSVEIRLSLDTFATIGLKAPFEAKRADFRKAFAPFSFKPIRVLVDDEPLFTGTLVDVSPAITPTARTVDVSGYSLPGVLQDCSAPGATVPHEFNKVGLRAIADQLCKPFGLKTKFEAPEGEKFQRVKLRQADGIFEFLADLARQRNIVISNTATGVVLFWRSVELGEPVAVLVEGEPPVASVSAEFSPQDYFSEITGFCGSRRGRKGTRHTEKNPWLKNIMRPTSFELEDTEKLEAPEATRAKLGRMFANAAKYTIADLPGWRDQLTGRLWQPNTTIKLTAPGAFIYRRSEFLIRNVMFTQDAQRESTTLELCLPGAFSGEAPAILPWDEPETAVVGT